MESACAPPLMMFIIGTGSSVRVRAAEVAEQRQLGRLGGGLGDGERDAEDRVGAELALVRGAVELDQRLRRSGAGRWPRSHRSPGRSRRARRRRPSARPCRRSATCRRRAARRPRTHRWMRRRAPRRGATVPSSSSDLDLDGRVAPGVEDFAGADGLDGGHVRAPSSAPGAGFDSFFVSGSSLVQSPALTRSRRPCRADEAGRREQARTRRPERRAVRAGLA